ncbi:MAG: hypothetical protein OHK0038_20320 [Flammeovirgaceae bacterium]
MKTPILSIANLVENPDHWAHCLRRAFPWVVYEQKGKFAEVQFDLDTVSPSTLISEDTLNMIDAFYGLYLIVKPELGEGKNIGNQRNRIFKVLSDDAESFSHKLLQMILEGLEK